MNKRVLAGMFTLFMAMAPWSGYAAQTIDSPHLDLGINGPTENCIYCHDQPELKTEPCAYCHKQQNGPYGSKATEDPITHEITITTTAPEVNAHKVTVSVDPVTHVATKQALECAACHNPHLANHVTAEVVTGSYTYDAATAFAIPGPLVLRETEVLGETTITVSNVLPPLDADWDKKSGSSYRGMILWVADGLEKASYEVVDVNTTPPATITVKGNLTLTSPPSGTFGLSRGQLIAKSVTKVLGKNYREGDLAVEFPPQGSSSYFVQTGAGPANGICQVCHTTKIDETGTEVPIKYWTSNGGGNTHNANRVCTECHKHKSGFAVTGCYACHRGDDENKDADGEPLVAGLDGSGNPSINLGPSGLADEGVTQLAYDSNTKQTLSGSLTAGQHKTHASAIGEWVTRTTGYKLGEISTNYKIVSRQTLDFTTVGAADNSPGTMFVFTGNGQVLGAGDSVLEMAPAYNYDCEVCHVGTGMDLANQDNIGYKDGIQIGFSTKFTTVGAKNYEGYMTSYTGQRGVAYVGTNNTSVPATGTGAVGENNLKCNNVYCHSDGSSVRRNCATATTNESQSWDWVTSTTTGDPQGDSVKCNNCHGFNSTAANPMASGSHAFHARDNDYPCVYCHVDTVRTLADGSVEIANKSNHVNGSYEVRGDFLRNGTTRTLVTYDKATRTCTQSCHTGARPWSVADAGTCPDVCATGGPGGGPVKNLDPVPNFIGVQISRNTLRFTDQSYDPDRNDPVAAQCLPYLGRTGHAGQNGRERIISGYNQELSVPLKFDGVTKKINDFAIPPQMRNTVDFPGKTVVWLMQQTIDNDPKSETNVGLKTHKDPLLKPYDGYVSSANTPYELNPTFDDSRVNVMPEITKVVSAVNLGGGSYQVTVTATVVDPDALDLTKNTLMGGHGHDGTVGATILMYWPDGTPAETATNVLLPDNTTSATRTFTRTLSGYPPTNAAIWLNITVKDAHNLDSTANVATAPWVSQNATTGWFNIVVQ